MYRVVLQELSNLEAEISAKANGERDSADKEQTSVVGRESGGTKPTGETSGSMENSGKA